MEKCKYYKKINVKNNYRKIEKEKDNDVDIDVVQLECSNNKYYASAFRDIYIYIYIDFYMLYLILYNSIVN